MAGRVPRIKGYHTITGVFVPPGLSRLPTEARVSIRDLDRIRKLSGFKLHNLLTAREVLTAPDRIFRHIRDGEDASGWC